MDTNVNPDAASIEAAGDVTAVARLLGVAPNVVGNWKTRGIPRAWRELLTVKCPDVDWRRHRDLNEQKEAA